MTTAVSPTPPAFTPKPIGERSDLLRYGRLFLHRKKVIAGVALLAMVLTAVYVFRQPRQYEAYASLIIDTSAPRFLDNQVQDVTELGNANYWYNREYFETQYKVISSRAVAERVVRKLGLESDLGFLRLDKVHDPDKRAKLLKEIDPVALLQAMIRLKPVKDSRIVMVGVNDTDASRAALLANELSEAYITENLDLKVRTSDSASTWLEDRLADLQEKSKKSEMAVYDFKKQQDILTTSLEDRQNMVSQRLLAYNEALTKVQTRIAELKARVDTIEGVRKSASAADETWASALPSMKENPLLDDLKRRYLTQKLECVDLEARYLPEHPSRLRCDEKLVSAKEDLLRELNHIASRSSVELKEATAQLANLQELVTRAKAEAFDVNKKQIAFERLKRESDNDQRMSDMVMKRLKEIELASMLRTSNVRVLDSALPPKFAVYPRPVYSLALALLFGLFAGMALCVLLELLDTTITNQADAEARLGVAFLGFVPKLARARADASLDLIVHEEPKSAVAECCRAIRTNLLFMTPDRPLKRMLVSSSSPQEGKSTTVISMGIAMAQSGNRVLVVDTDMRRPRLHRAFKVPNEKGVSSIIVGNDTIEAAVKSTDVPNLFVLPCGPLPPNPAELLHTAAFRELLDKLGERYDRIILDSPPVGAVADAAVLATLSDGVLLVLKAGHTNRTLAERAVKALRDVNAHILGTILNQLDVEDPKYGAYYYAYQRYGYYYGDKSERPAA